MVRLYIPTRYPRVSESVTNISRSFTFPPIDLKQLPRTSSSLGQAAPSIRIAAQPSLYAFCLTDPDLLALLYSADFACPYCLGCGITIGSRRFTLAFVAFSGNTSLGYPLLLKIHVGTCWFLGFPALLVIVLA